MPPGRAILPRVAVVGAGMAGLSCARTLLMHGASSVVVLEKSAGYGGRCATRDWRGSVVDHGVQFFTLRSTLIRQLVTQTLPLAPGDLQILPLGAVRTAIDHAPVHISSGDRMYLASGNATLGTVLARGIDVRLQHLVHDVDPSGRVEYDTPDGTRKIDYFDAVVCSAPLPQTAALLDTPTPPDWPTAFVPNLTAILEYDTDKLPLTALSRPPPGRAARLYALYAPHNHPVLTWSACENAKIGRRIAPGKTIMVVQASDAFSAAHVDDEMSKQHPQGPQADQKDHFRADWIDELANAVEDMWQLDRDALVAGFCKRWRYARVDPNARGRDITTVEQPGERMFVCGDGVARRSRVEHAILNGHYAAQRVASTFTAGAIPAWSAT